MLVPFLPASQSAMMTMAPMGQVSDIRIVDGDPDEYFRVSNEGGSFHIKTQSSFKSTSPGYFNLTVVAIGSRKPTKDNNTDNSSGDIRIIYPCNVLPWPTDEHVYL